MANYDNPNGFRPAFAGIRRRKVTVGAAAVNEGDVLGMAAGVAALYSAATHPKGPYGVAAVDGAIGAEIDVYVITPEAIFIGQFDGTYAVTSHDNERFEISGATGAQQIVTTSTRGLVQVLGHAPEQGSTAVGANARVFCRFLVCEAVPVSSARSSSVPAAGADEVENTTTATAHTTTKTLDVSELRVGDIIEYEVAWKVTDNNSTDTLATAVKVGSVTLSSSVAADVADADIIVHRGWFEVKVLGASGFIQGVGQVSGKFGSTFPSVPVLIGPDQAIDLSADINLTGVSTWSVAHADNEVDLHAMTLRRIPAGL